MFNNHYRIVNAKVDYDHFILKNKWKFEFHGKSAKIKNRALVEFRRFHLKFSTMIKKLKKLK